MGINVYATKSFENEEYVTYIYGSDIENQRGKIKIIKNRLQLEIVENDESDKKSYALFKVAMKIKGLYKEKGKFPEKVTSTS